jgi:hypothetical protein
VANCIHGFAPGECLICQTLSGKAATATKPASGRGVLSRPAAPAPPAAPPGGVATRRGGPSLGMRFAGALIVGVIALLAVWWAFHLVLYILHLLEVIAAALVAGYLGWVAGVHHGRRLERKGR